MFTLRTLNELTIDLPENTLVQVSCFTKEYIKENPNNADYGQLLFTENEVVFVIDFSENNIFTLGDFRTLLNEHQNMLDNNIIMIDNDDCNEIEIEDVVVVDSKVIII